MGTEILIETNFIQCTKNIFLNTATFWYVHLNISLIFEVECVWNGVPMYRLTDVWIKNRFSLIFNPSVVGSKCSVQFL